MRITFRLKDNRDEDLLQWFNALGEGERSFFIRQALRRGLSSREEKVSIPIIKGEMPKLPKEEPVTAEEAESRLSSLINNL
jgi:hypothetical protein